MSPTSISRSGLGASLPGQCARSGERPLIFVHYGPSSYLRHALRSACRSNPKKTVFLLGDESNRRYVPRGASYVPLSALYDSPLRREFASVFRVIQGKRHRFTKTGGVEKWLTFVFERWFLVAEFARRRQIDSFWIFDSDTLVLAPLAGREQRFSGFEATTQCGDCCLNGFIASRALVDRYLACMTALFREPDFLAAQRARLEKHAGLAFNEMDAFCEFRKRQEVATTHAAVPRDGEFFDDALAYDPKFEESPRKVAGHIRVKRIWRSPDGALYARHLQSGKLVRMVTCNLSWLPDYVWRRLSPSVLTPEQDADISPPNPGELRELDLSPSLADKVASALRVKLFELRRGLRVG